ncbi:hypothetical protein KC343_g22431, partial [Hortaea werneckii]
RPRTGARTESTETTGSTPQTDTTDYPWSDEKSSTGMTSAAVTPARGSKRTSSQALQAGSESGSAPKLEPMTDDWMRQELEKLKKAQDEKQQQQQQHQEKTASEPKASGDETDTTPKIITQVPTPSIAKVPPRKPRCDEWRNDPVAECTGERRVKLSFESRKQTSKDIVSGSK